VEHQVSVASARTVARGLTEAGHQVHPLGIGPDGCWIEAATAQRALDGAIDRLPEGGITAARSLAPLLEAEVDLLFPIIHGTWGEDGTLQGFCEILDLPYAGPGVATSAIAMDKVCCKQILAQKGIPVVECEVVTDQELLVNQAAVSERLAGLEPPLFVKPAVGGSSVGISKVMSRRDLLGAIEHALRFDDRVLVERGVAGRELECAVLGYRTIEASAVGEIVPGGDFYDYSDKYLDDRAGLIAPANIAPEVEVRIRELSAVAFAAIGGHGMARVDFLLEGESRLYLNEINTHPGFTDISMYPRLWGISGLPLPELVDRLVEIAIERHADRRRLDQGIKTWLAELAER
jgi:D-alanine-D-alanine ligase